MEDKKQRKELKVSAIENGTVIDHIPAKSLFQVVNILDLEGFENLILFGTNLDSKKFGKKGLIQVRGKYIKPEEINKIALVAPTATLIVIKDYAVVLKKRVETPDEIVKLVKCYNPNCITNHEKIDTRFSVHSSKDLNLKCQYCEKIMERKNMVFL